MRTACASRPELADAPILGGPGSSVAMKVAVLGATGFVGRALLPALVDGGHEVTAVSRSRAPQERRGVTWVPADVTDAAAVQAALEGVDAVHYLVHSLGAKDFQERDRVAADVVAREAERSGVRQIVYLGGLGEESAELSAHLRSRRETGRRLAAGRVPVTTLRAAVVVGLGSAAFETILALVDRLPAMVCPRWVTTETQPIALGDVVRYLAGVSGLEGALGETFDVGGPDVMTYREMIERVASLRGRHPLIVEVPVLSPRLSSYWLNLVTPVRASVARPLIDGLRARTVAEDDRIRALVPSEPTPFEEAAREALAGRSSGGRS
jgi:uncharacterized protein YbjT (DUF2867 family)